MDHDVHDHDRGLAFDLSTLLRRRGMLGLIAGAGMVSLVGCGDGTSGGTATASNSVGSTTGSSAAGSTAAGSGASCDPIPRETAGPYPGDGTNGPNILTQSGIVRSDIRSSFGSGSGVAAGVPLTINLTIQSRAKGCAAFAGAAVYLWHCDRDGQYSMYSPNVTRENYLRGVQGADSNGLVTFKSIFPAAYPGRWPHIHFEVYPSVAGATVAGSKITTSQLALPDEVCKAVYATDGYASSARNHSRTTLASDNVFSDGVTKQLATVTGSASSGLVANLFVPV